MTGGEAHEVKGYRVLVEFCEAQPEKLIGDKGYDSNAIRKDLEQRGVEPVIPPKSNRIETIEYDEESYKHRNLIERCVNALKQFRHIASPTRKPQEPTSPCYVSAQHASGSKPSTRPSYSKLYRREGQSPVLAHYSYPSRIGARLRLIGHPSFRRQFGSPLKRGPKPGSRSPQQKLDVFTLSATSY